MGENTSGGTFIELTASIVSAYVSNNSVPRADRPSARRLDAGLERARRCAERAAETRRLGQEVDHAGLHRLPRGWKEVQIAQAAFAHAIQHDAGAVPREMGIGGRLSDGGAELCGGSFAPRQANGARPAAAAAQIGPQSGIGSRSIDRFIEFHKREGPGEVVAGA